MLRRVRHCPWTVVAVVVGIASAPVVTPRIAMAGPAAAEAPPATQPSEDQAAARTRARRLYRRGAAKFETLDYIGAIELWTRAYSELEESPDNRSIRARLMFNIAAARVAQYDIDNNTSHLRQAKGLMTRYVGQIESVYGGDQAAQEKEEAQAWLTKIDAKLAEAEDATTTVTDDPDPTPDPDPVPVGPVDDPRVTKRARALTIAGIVTASVGVGLIGAMAGGLAWGRSLEQDGDGEVEDDPNVPAGDLSGIVDDGQTANGLAIGAGVAGGVLLVTGVTLIAVGQVQKRKARSTTAARTAFVPVAGPTGFGARLEVRF